MKESKASVSLKDAMETMRLVLTGEATDASADDAFEAIVDYVTHLDREEDPFLPRDVVMGLLMRWTKQGLRKICFVFPPLPWTDPSELAYEYEDVEYQERARKFETFQGELAALAWA